MASQPLLRVEYRKHPDGELHHGVRPGSRRRVQPHQSQPIVVGRDRDQSGEGEVSQAATVDVSRHVCCKFRRRLLLSGGGLANSERGRREQCFGCGQTDT